MHHRLEMPYQAQPTPVVYNKQRRLFIINTLKLAGGAAALNLPVVSIASSHPGGNAAITVGEIMDLFIKQVPEAPFANTVDTLKAGSSDIVVTGVVTTMFATVEVIQQAIDAKANFIIAHEPTFYNHADDTDWLKQDDVYQFKPDVLICGEIQEWETAEYVRDARAKGMQLSLVVLGHIVSEEPGSEFMAKWIAQNVPGVPVTHIPTGSVLQFA